MRAAAILGAIVLAAAASGCTGGEEEPPPRSEAAETLAALCETARLDIEALGLPSETGYTVLKPWAARGKRLAADIRAIDGEPDESRQLDELASELEEYYRGLALGYEIYRKTKNSEVYAAGISRAEVFLQAAEKRSLALGADECAIRPFPDFVPE